MTSNTEFQRLARRESSSGTVAARLGMRSWQAQPGRHHATACTFACWNIRSLNITSDHLSHNIRKSAVINHELTRLRIDLTALSETWLTGNGSIREDSYTIFWTEYPDSERPHH